MTNEINLADVRALWLKRWQAVEAAIGEIQERIQANNDLRLATSYLLLSRLRDFAQAQFFFFFDGFREEGQAALHSAVRLDLLNRISLLRIGISSNIPYRIDEYIFHTVFDQITSDLLAIERSIGQWRALAQDRTLGPFIETQQKAVALAHLSLLPFRPYVKEYATVLATGDRAAYTRIFPYAPISLMSVPFTSASVSRDYLMIPHEVAHYVFWHGRRTDSALLHNALDGALELYGNTLNESVIAWTEEIFADVLSVLIAGPVMALSIQDIMLSSVGSSFDYDDGVHPIPRIRPYIHLHVLSQMKNMASIYTQLADRWLAHENNRPMPFGAPLLDLRSASLAHPLNILGSQTPTFTSMAKNEVVKQVMLIVNMILNLFESELTRGNQVWIQEQNVDLLYSAFAAFLEQKQPLAEETYLTEFLHVEQWDQAYQWGAQVQQKYQFSADLKQTNSVVVPTWLDIWAFEGWTIGGGGPGNVPKRFVQRRLQR